MRGDPAGRERDPLRGGEADEEGADEAGARRDRDAVEVAEVAPDGVERLGEERVQRLDVGAARVG